MWKNEAPWEGDISNITLLTLHCVVPGLPLSSLSWVVGNNKVTKGPSSSKWNFCKKKKKKCNFLKLNKPTAI